MIVPRRPDASSPGPSGPDLFSPTGGSFRSAVLVTADIWLSCHSISAVTVPGRSGAASPAALAAYAAAPRACAPMWGMAAACPAALATAAAAGVATSRAAAPPTKRRRISSATSSSPRAKARVRAMASRGRLSPGASASNNHSTRCAQSAAHPATIRLSASLSACGEPSPLILPPGTPEPCPGGLLLDEVARPCAGRGCPRLRGRCRTKPSARLFVVARSQETQLARRSLVEKPTPERVSHKQSPLFGTHN